jgi:SnoaL-like domain
MRDSCLRNSPPYPSVNTQKAAEMFDDNGAFEMPYLESLRFPSHYQGREKIHGFFNFVRELYPDLQFHDVTIVCETPDVVVAEYEFTTPSSKTGRLIHQLFVGRLESAKERSSSFASPSTRSNQVLRPTRAVSPTTERLSSELARADESQRVEVWKWQESL